MAFWVRAFCRKTVGATRPEELTAGIGQRLSLLTALYCPDKEESPKTVLARLTVAPLRGESGFQAWVLRWQPEPNPFIRVERWTGDRAQSEIAEIRARFSGRSGGEVETVRAVLDAAIETVGFELRQGDLDTMGWPVAVAAAAFVAERGDGLIHADTDGWSKPTAREVKRILADR